MDVSAFPAPKGTAFELSHLTSKTCHQGPRSYFESEEEGGGGGAEAPPAPPPPRALVTSVKFDDTYRTFSYISLLTH